jgi:hypothetical protein
MGGVNDALKADCIVAPIVRLRGRTARPIAAEVPVVVIDIRWFPES